MGLKELKEHLYTDSILKTISKPEEYNVLTNKSPFAAHFKNLIENKGDYSVLKIKDKEYLTLQQNIDETNWKLIILIDKDNIYSSIENLKSLSDKVGYIAIIFLVFFYVLFFTFLLRRINVFSNSITEPIIDLSKQTSEISIRKTDVRIINTNILEIHQLSSNFVSMINELNERNKKLHKAKRKAIEANKIKSEFLANMSHEIRTPLNGIIGLTELVLQSELNEIQKDYLLKSQQSSKSLLHIINDILDYSKIEAGKLDIAKERFSLNELMKNISYLFSYMIYDKDLEFNFTIDKDINKILIGDSLRITQVLNNFVGNAIKFTSKGFIRIDVTLISKTDKLMHLRFSVVDSGIGIAKENQSKLFQAFNQEDSSTTKKFGGTGLGLSISKQLIDLMDAKLIFESQKDLGSTFGFEIALEYDTNALDVPKHHENLKDQKFLIIDDNEIDREYLYNLLNSWDIEALKAKDGLEAYDILKSKEIDYILVDWMMPELDGLELLQKLQDDNIKVPNILMITAYNKNELLQKAKQNNISINKVLEKPYTPSSLYNVLFDNVKDILNSSD